MYQGISRWIRQGVAVRPAVCQLGIDEPRHGITERHRGHDRRQQRSAVGGVGAGPSTPTRNAGRGIGTGGIAVRTRRSDQIAARRVDDSRSGRRRRPSASCRDSRCSGGRRRARTRRAVHPASSPKSTCRCPSQTTGSTRPPRGDRGSSSRCRRSGCVRTRPAADTRASGCRAGRRRPRPCARSRYVSTSRISFVAVSIRYAYRSSLSDGDP